MTTAVAKTSEGTVSTFTQKRGLERVTKDDLTVPKIILTQPLSNFVLVDGKQAGVFVNSVTRETYKDVTFTPVIFSKYWDGLKPEGNKMVFDFRTFNENDPRLSGKRFFPEKDEQTGQRLPAQVNFVRAFLSIVEGKPVMITFSKANSKTGKRLIDLAAAKEGDFFAWSYKLTVARETRQGNTYFVSVVEDAGKADEATFKIAENIYNSFGAKVEAVNTDSAVDEEVGF